MSEKFTVARLTKDNEHFDQAKSGQERDRIRDEMTKDWEALVKGGVILKENPDEGQKYVFAPKFVDMMKNRKSAKILGSVDQTLGNEKQKEPPEQEQGKHPSGLLGKYNTAERVQKAKRVHEIASLLGPIPNLPDDTPIGNTTAGKLRQEMAELQQSP